MSTDTLREEFWESLEITEDETEGDRRMKVVGVVQQADVVNKNKRLYSHAILETAVKAITPALNEMRVFGQVDHPEMRGKLKETSHIVTGLEWKGKQLMGEMLVLNTPSGKLIAEILRAGGRPGFSSRGRGKAEPVQIKGKGEVQRIADGFRFEAFDFVLDPAVKTAKIKKIIEHAELSEELDSKINEELRARLQRIAGIEVKKRERGDRTDSLRGRIRREAGIV